MQQVSTRQHRIDTPKGQLFAQCWTPAGESGAPLVLLHDSLGSVALWRDFPERLALANGRRVIAYDRLGFGRSDAHPGALAPSFVEDEAQEGFLALHQQLGLDAFVVLGHSVGGGMAIGCAVAHPQRCLGVITESAQAFVEANTREGIRAAERRFAKPGQLERLRKYHGDKAEWVLRAWVDTWLSDAFAHWSLDPQLPQVRCPLLSLHGDQDEFGSPRHPARIASLVSGPAQRHILEGCGHVPHREQAETVLGLVGSFLRALS